MIEIVFLSIVLTALAAVFITAVKKLPSTERHGRWVAVENDIDYYPFMCSECYETVIKKTNYCPRCGAKMDIVKGE